MARFIVQYKMHTNNNRGKTIPYFIEDAGYFAVEGRKFIGITYDEKEVYLPPSVKTYTNTELINFIKELGIRDNEGILLTTEEKEIYANNWLSERGF